MSLIRTIGLFWKADDVFWGRPNKKGTLLGVPAGQTTTQPIDFRDQAGLYILYADYTPVYVGQTSGERFRLFTRLKQHLSNDLAGRWNRFSWFGILRVLGNGNLSQDIGALHTDLSEALNQMEAVLIHGMEPPLNRQGGRFGESVIRYLQYRDDNLGPTVEEMIKTIYDTKNN
jgi:hypothetical protein